MRIAGSPKNGSLGWSVPTNSETPGLPEINRDPLFRNLHDNPRYAELLKKMQLPI
jgi:hypothetical protein